MHLHLEFNQLKQVGTISLWFGLVALVGLAVVLWLSDLPLDHYEEATRTLALTRQQLPGLMLVGGLLLTIGTALTTWLITLYSSFRVAGPLYRFSRNLEAGIQKGEVPRIQIRAKDYLQTEGVLLDQTMAAVYDYYARLDEALDAVQKQLASDAAVDAADLNQALIHLDDLSGQAVLDRER